MSNEWGRLSKAFRDKSSAERALREHIELFVSHNLVFPVKELHLSAIQLGVWLRYARLRSFFFCKRCINHLSVICLYHAWWVFWQDIDKRFIVVSCKIRAFPVALLFKTFLPYRALNLSLTWFSFCFGWKQAHSFFSATVFLCSAVSKSLVWIICRRYLSLLSSF